jgi:hypothetical protein
VSVFERLRFEHYVVAGAAVALFAGVLLFGVPMAGPGPGSEEALDGHSRATTGSGTRALELLLKESGAAVVRHERRLDLIRSDVRVLFSISPQKGLEPGEEEGLFRWIADGGTFVLMARSDEFVKKILDRLGLQWVRIGSPPPADPVQVDLSRFWPELKTPYFIEPGAGARLTKSADAIVSLQPVALSEDAKGWIVAGARWGSGSIVVFSDPRPARNEALLKAQHDVLMVHLALAAAQRGKVGLDEFHHGYAEGQGPLAYAMDTAAGPAVIHAVLVLILLVLATNRRLGPARIVREEERRRSLEFVEALARLCRASKNSGLAVQLVLTDVLDSIQGRFGGSDPETLARVSSRLGIDGRRVAETVNGARRLAHERPSPAELVRQVRELEQVRRRLALAKGR